MNDKHIQGTYDMVMFKNKNRVTEIIVYDPRISFWFQKSI